MVKECCLSLKLTHNISLKLHSSVVLVLKVPHAVKTSVDFRPDDGGEGVALVIDVRECLMSILNAFYCYSSIVMLHVCSQLHMMQLRM